MLRIDEIYEYSARVRRKFVTTLERIPWEEVIRDREASFHSMKNIVVHMLEVEEWMIGWVILGKKMAYREDRFGDYQSMKKLKVYLERVERKTREYLTRADEKELNRVVKLRLERGEVRLTVEECLFQSFTEQIYHLGELIALLWQEDIEPPEMQWFYNNPRNQTT